MILAPERRRTFRRLLHTSSMEAIMQRRRHPGDSSANLVAAILAAVMLGIFALVFVYNFSGDRATFAGKNVPQATTGQSTLQ